MPNWTEINKILEEWRKENTTTLGELKEFSESFSKVTYPQPEEIIKEIMYGVQNSRGIFNYSNDESNPISGNDIMGIIDLLFLFELPITGYCIGIANERMKKAHIYSLASVASDTKRYTNSITNYLSSIAIALLQDGQQAQ